MAFNVSLGVILLLIKWYAIDSIPQKFQKTQILHYGSTHCLVTPLFLMQSVFPIVPYEVLQYIYIYGINYTFKCLEHWYLVVKFWNLFFGVNLGCSPT